MFVYHCLSFWSLYWLLFFDLRHQIAPFVIFLLVIVLVVILRPTVSDCPLCHFSFGHCIGCYSSTYGIRLLLLSFLFWLLYWLSFFDLRHQIAPFVIFLLVIVLVVILRPTASDCPFCHFSFGTLPLWYLHDEYFGHFIVCPCLTCLPLWYLHTFLTHQ